VKLFSGGISRLNRLRAMGTGAQWAEVAAVAGPGASSRAAVRRAERQARWYPTMTGALRDHLPVQP
jgi:hypothetical protein